MEERRARLSEILAIDPGLTKPGAALMRDGVLVRADRLRIPKEWSKLEILDRCYLVARAAVDFGLAIGMGGLHSRGLELVVEWPQWYGDDRTIDPNDLAGLCGICGAAIGILRTMSRGDLVTSRSPKPREVWGNVPKSTKGDPWKSPRGQRLRDRLSELERPRVARYHDALDAAGLALYAADRWKQRRLYPGAV